MAETPSGAQRVAAAIDVGGSKAITGIVGRDGSIRALAQIEVRGARVDAVQVELIGRLRAAIEQASADGLHVTSLGVGATGRHDAREGRLGAIDAVLPGWGGSALPREVAAALGLPLKALLNDADAAALAECHVGAGRGADPCVVVTLGTGIGVAVVRDGVIATGVAGAHGEFGHIVVDPNGPSCFCGASGCWESLSGGGAIERAWAAAQPSSARASAAQIFDADASGDLAAATIIAAAVAATATGIANIAVALAPEAIVIGGGIGARWERFRTSVEAELAARRPIISTPPRIVPAAFGTAAVLVGAGIAALEASGVRSASVEAFA